MNASPSLVWALPDLALLACPRPVDHYDRSFYDDYWRHVIETHVPKCREYGFAMLLSDEVVSWLAQHFPFTEVGQGSWVDDFLIDFFEFLKEIRKEWPDPAQIGMPDNPVLIDPHIIPPFVAPGLRDAWLDLLAWSVGQPGAEHYIASLQGLHVPVTSIDVLDMNNAPLCVIKLVPQALSWETILARLDPWVATRLPKTGAWPYRPRQPWHSGQRFPWHTEQMGYLDDDGRVWVWDRLHKNHWDIQFDPRRVDDYDRVYPDGSLLDGHD